MTRWMYLPGKGPVKRPPKFGNVKYTAEDGETFDSLREFRRYAGLLLLQQAGLISGLERQVKFVLIPSQKDPATGKVIEREVAYYADFAYTDLETGKRVVEDAKGFKTKEYVIKRKLMLYVHGIRVRET